MVAAFEALRSEFRNFGTEAISLALTAVAILFFVAERGKMNRQIEKLTKYEILFFLLLANPFGYYVISGFWMQEDYRYMFLLLVPVVLVAAFVVELTCGFSRVWERALCLAGCVGLVMVSMYFMFGTVTVQRLQNEYKVSENIVELDTLLRQENHTITNMIAPREVCVEIRALNESVQLLYGEDLITQMEAGETVFTDEAEEEFFEACKVVVAVPQDVDKQLALAETYGSNCIVLEISYDDEAQMTAAGYWCYGKTDCYAVYFKD